MGGLEMICVYLEPWWLNPTKQGLFIVYLTVLVYFDIFGYLRLLVGIPVLIILQTYRHDTLNIYIYTQHPWKWHRQTLKQNRYFEYVELSF